MAWLLLVVAGLFEVVWAYFMKQSAGFTRLWPSVATLGFMGISFALLGVSMKTLPMGVAYSVWTGIGAVGALIVGVLVLHERLNALQVLAAALIVGGLVLMRVSTPQA
ncbi:multidrug efflux SMR transporter [Brevundimonas sp. 2R-24]|uniref:Guanidinium exporter n=1 Tax=Peiella sedimenti TaxID=3061083 RepID=A0ABT8SK76_9CAUL|nr:multidrug efflux SMR transporter [Caulobacteraceae bacterium XZ-24]